MKKLVSLISWPQETRSSETGQGVVEYALVLGVLVVALFIAFTTTDIATGISNAIGGIVDTLNGA